MNRHALAQADSAYGVAAPPAPPESTLHPSPIAGDFGSFERRYYLGEPRSPAAASAFALEHLRGRLAEKPYAVLSLDVFDTLMLRNAKCERRRFWEIAERWRERLPASARGVETLDLYLARLRAAHISYSCGPIHAGTQEGRLDNLTALALSLLKLPQTLAQAFIEIELDYEAENLAPNPLILETLAHYASQDGRVMLLSDMYMSGSQIHSLISRFGLSKIAPYVYSSADITLNKRSGTIFVPAARQLRVEPDAILHIGDNFHADFSMPRLAGFAAQHLPVPLCEEQLRGEDERAFLDSVEGADL